jgi:hypothetical protein
VNYGFGSGGDLRVLGKDPMFLSNAVLLSFPAPLTRLTSLLMPSGIHAVRQSKLNSIIKNTPYTAVIFLMLLKIEA